MPKLNLERFLLSADGSRLNLRAYALLALVALAFFLPGFTSLPPTDRDESLFSQASKQMIESGDYIDIRFQKEPRYKKPIGIYWLQSASAQLFGAPPYNDIVVYRLPSLVGAVIAVLATAALGATLFSPMAGFYAALLMASSLLLNVEARLAKTDAALLACIMLSQLALARAYRDRIFTRRNFLLFWIALAAGILIKGPIILLVLLSTLVWLRISNKELSWFTALRPRYGAPLLLLLIAPWFIAIILQSHGAFVAQSAGHDLLAKIWQGQDRGILPPGLHALASPLVFFPGILFIALAAPDILRNRRTASMRFCLGWLIPTWCVFELSLTKLPHYVLPAYPALALLAGHALAQGYPALFDEGKRWWTGLTVLIWTVVGIALAGVHIALPYGMNNHSVNLLPIVAGAVLIIAQIACLLFFLRRRRSALPIIVGAQLILSTSIFGFTLPTLQHLWLARDVVTLAQERMSCAPAHIISASYNEPSLILLAGTDTEQINDTTKLAEQLKQPSCKLALLDQDHDAAFNLAATKDGLAITMIGNVEGYNLGSGHHVSLNLYTRQDNLR